LLHNNQTYGAPRGHGIRESGPYWAHFYENISDPDEGYLMFLVLKEEHKIHEKENKENKRNKENLRNCYNDVKPNKERTSEKLGDQRTQKNRKTPPHRNRYEPAPV